MIRKIDYINTIFTQVVNEYLQAGWTIYTQSMSGSQGEKAKVDLTNGEKVYRVILETGTEYLDNRWGVDTLEIEVRVFDIPHNGRTLWNNEGKLIKNITWYKVDKYHRRDNDVYVTTKAEIEEIWDKQMKRIRNNNFGYETWTEVEIRPAYLDKVRDMCRAYRGYGKVKRAMIAKLEKSSRGEYRVEFTAESGKQRLIIKKIGG